jgi:hypothetical protein
VDNAQGGTIDYLSRYCIIKVYAHFEEQNMKALDISGYEILENIDWSSWPAWLVLAAVGAVGVWLLAVALSKALDSSGSSS